MKAFKDVQLYPGEAGAYEILHKAVNEVFEQYETVPTEELSVYLENSCEKLKKMVVIMIDNHKKQLIEIGKL